MTKITEYFYIFSKLTTSLVLFLIIIVMGYAFFKSYQGIDDNNVNLENKLSSLSSDVMLNYNNFEKIVRKYDLENYIILIIYQNQKEINVLSKLQLNNSYKIFNISYKDIDIGDEKSILKLITNIKCFYVLIK